MKNKKSINTNEYPKTKEIKSTDSETFIWNRKELKLRNRKSIFTRGFKPYIVLILVIFIFSFVGIINSSASNEINVIDMQFGESAVNEKIIKKTTDYILNTTLVSGLSEEIKQKVVTPFAENLIVNHGLLLSVFSMNESYVDRNIGEVIALIIIITVIVTAVSYFIKKTMSVGEYRYFMEYRFQQKVRIRRIFAPFGNGKWFRVFRTMCAYQLVTLLWGLTIIGIFTKCVSYSFVPIIVAENPSIRWRDAKRLSSQMTYGYKRKIIYTYLSYFYLLLITSIPFVNLFIVSPILDNIYVEMYFKLRSRPDIDKSFFIETGFNNEAYIDRISAGESADEIKPEYVMQDFSIKGSSFDENDKYTLIEFIFMFFLFSFVGWIWEVGIHLVQDHVFVNRGTMYGPWLPIYGSGGAFIIVLLSRYKNKKAKLFVLTMALCGILEYVTSLVLDFVDNAEYWNYDDMFANFNGRVCLAGLIAFALGGFLGIYILGPLIKRLVERIGRKRSIIICTICVSAFIIDYICCKIFGNNSGEGIGTKLSMISYFING